MYITFTNGEVFSWSPDDMGPSVNGGGNNMGWIIVAPWNWEIDYVDKGNNNESGSLLKTNESGNPQFNISGFNPYAKPKITIEKVWLDEDGARMDEGDIVGLEAFFTINDEGKYAPGTYTLLPGTYTVKETFSSDGFTILTPPIIITLKPNDEEVITFENQKQWATIEIVKEWIGAEDVESFIITDLQRNTVDFGREGTYQVKAGTYIIIEEDIEGFELVSIVVGEEEIKGSKEAVVTVKAGENKKVIFTNEELPLPYLDLDPITSHDHVAKWFAKYGILVIAYGADSTHAAGHDGEYFVAFDTEKYSSVTIGFGSSASDAYTNDKVKTFVAEDCEECNVYDLLCIIINGNGWLNSEGYFDTSALEDLGICWFDNPWAHGGHHLYLLNYVEK
jgi:hypothetical protein